MNRTVLVGLVALAVSLAGCKKSPNPSSPTATTTAATAASTTDGTADGTTDAAPDGSTLKVTAPAPVSPASGEKVQTRRPALVVRNSTGRHQSVASNYQFELSNTSSVLYTSGQIAPGVSQTEHTLPNDLAYDTDYRFRARAILTADAETLVGPWSGYIAFRSPDTPVVIDAPVLLTPPDNQILTTRSPELVVTNGGVSGPAGPVVYRFELANDPVFASVVGVVVAPRSNAATTSASFGELPASRQFYWRVSGTDGKVQSPVSSVRSFRTPDPPPPTPTPTPTPTGGGIGPPRSIGINEAASIIIDVHNRLGYNLGSSSAREYRIEFLYAAVGVLHYGHSQFNPQGPDSDWCVKDAGGGRPPSDDVLVRCRSREAWDLIGGAGANGYTWHLDYLGTLPSNQNVYAPPRGSLPRDNAPPPGNPSIPLPNVQAFVRQASDARPDLLAGSCPGGVKYRNNPWLDYIIGLLRAQDTRWGYNRKPTRTAADNGGLPVIAAGDEIAYYFGTGTAEGSPDVYLIDVLEGHCGPTPRVTYRVFTGEEPGIWTSLGRF